MASGNQIWKGIMADLPAPPIKISIMAQDKTDAPINVAVMGWPNTLPFGSFNSTKLNVPE